MGQHSDSRDPERWNMLSKASVSPQDSYNPGCRLGSCISASYMSSPILDECLPSAIQSRGTSLHPITRTQMWAPKSNKSWHHTKSLQSSW